MNEQLTNELIEHSDATFAARQTSPVLQLAEARDRHRKIRIALRTLPRRQSCVTRRTLLAALREAEMDEWMSTGGDYLNIHRRD